MQMANEACQTNKDCCSTNSVTALKAKKTSLSMDLLSHPKLACGSFNFVNDQ